jgi:hypothetical protein
MRTNGEAREPVPVILSGPYNHLRRGPCDRGQCLVLQVLPFLFYLTGPFWTVLSVSEPTADGASYSFDAASRGLEWRYMAELSWLREQAERALRFARDSTDPMLKKQLETLAAEYTAQADAIEDGKPDVLGPDPEE